MRGALLVMAPFGLPHAAEMVHGLMNPSFGGNPGYYGNLTGHANTINSYKDPEVEKAKAEKKLAEDTSKIEKEKEQAREPTTGEVFQKRLESLMLSALATRLVNQTFGQQDGTQLPEEINTGFNTITISDIEQTTRLTITDNATGGKTVIDIPKF